MLTNLPAYNAITVNASEGTLEVFLVFQITADNQDTFYVYDSSDLTNFQKALVLSLDSQQNDYYRQVASNRSFTFFYTCNRCSGFEKAQIVYRIVDYHSVNCNKLFNENIGKFKNISCRFPLMLF